jgi:hypothetical protein
VCVEGTRILAGLTLCYRQVIIDANQPIDVCVISAAATLPSERGHGHYRTLLDAALGRSRGKGCVAALGFVTCDNGSGRGLMRLGARAIPSFYIVATTRPRMRGRASACLPAPQAVANAEGWPELGSGLAELARQKSARRDRSAIPQASFYYERAEDWTQQFIRRPNAVRAVRLMHDSFALLERVGSTDRLQWLACPEAKATRSISKLAAASAATAHEFFAYTLDPCQAAAAQRAGLKLRSGYLMLQPTGYSPSRWDELASASWHLQSGDRL